MSLFDNQIDPTTVKLEDFVGEGKKYKSTDDVAKAIVEKDTFIQRLQNENAEMRKTMTSADKTQEILDRLETLKTATAEHQPEPQVVERVEHIGITNEDVEKLLEQRERRQQAVRNVETVKAELIKTYGPNYGSTLKSMAEGMGVTPEYLEGIAASSPAAFLRLVAPPKSDGVFTPPVGTAHATGFTPTAGAPKPKSHYEKLKQSNRAEYFSPAVQNQMYKDAMSLKEDFYDVP